MFTPDINDFATYRDIYRDAFGSRPRGPACEWATEAEFRADFDQVAEMADEAAHRDEIAEYEAELAFDSRLDLFIAMGARNRAAAFRWLLQAEGLSHETDMGYVCYTLRLPYRMEQELVKLRKGGRA